MIILLKGFRWITDTNEQNFSIEISTEFIMMLMITKMMRTMANIMIKISYLDQGKHTCYYTVMV
jgi:hypothetical protein